MPVAVTVTNPAIPSVNEKFASLVAADFTGGINRLRLGVMDGCEARVSFAPDSPFSFDGDNVLVLAHMVCFVLGCCCGLNQAAFQAQ